MASRAGGDPHKAALSSAIAKKLKHYAPELYLPYKEGKIKPPAWALPGGVPPGSLVKKARKTSMGKSVSKAKSDASKASRGVAHGILGKPSTKSERHLRQTLVDAPKGLKQDQGGILDFSGGESTGSTPNLHPVKLNHEDETAAQIARALLGKGHTIASHAVFDKLSKSFADKIESQSKHDDSGKSQQAAIEANLERVKVIAREQALHQVTDQGWIDHFKEHPHLGHSGINDQSLSEARHAFIQGEHVPLWAIPKGYDVALYRGENTDIPAAFGRIIDVKQDKIKGLQDAKKLTYVLQSLEHRDLKENVDVQVTSGPKAFYVRHAAFPVGEAAARGGDYPVTSEDGGLAHVGQLLMGTQHEDQTLPLSGRRLLGSIRHAPPIAKSFLKDAKIEGYDLTPEERDLQNHALDKLFTTFKTGIKEKDDPRKQHELLVQTVQNAFDKLPSDWPMYKKFQYYYELAHQRHSSFLNARSYTEDATADEPGKSSFGASGGQDLLMELFGSLGGRQLKTMKDVRAVVDHYLKHPPHTQGHFPTEEEYKKMLKDARRTHSR